MSRFKNKVPSEAQAKRIAHLWASGKGVQIAKEYTEATSAVLLREGWIEPTGERGKYPIGWEYEVHKLSAKGLRALHTYFVAKGLAYAR